MDHVKSEIWDLVAGTFIIVFISGMAFIIATAI